MPGLIFCIRIIKQKKRKSMNHDWKCQAKNPFGIKNAICYINATALQNIGVLSSGSL